MRTQALLLVALVLGTLAVTPVVGTAAATHPCHSDDPLNCTHPPLRRVVCSFLVTHGISIRLLCPEG